MSNKAFNSLVVILSVILIFLITSGTYYCSSYRFNKTTGIYIKGLNSTQIGYVSAGGIDKEGHTVGNVHCFEHYRKSDNYIFQNWRRDLRFYRLISKIQIYIPDTLVGKIEMIWLKCGKEVYKCDGNEFRKNWRAPSGHSRSLYSVPGNIFPGSGLKDGFICFFKTDFPYINRLKYICCLLFFFIGVLILWRFRQSMNSIIFKAYESYKRSSFAKGKFLRHFLAFIAGTIFVFVFMECVLNIVGHFHNKNNIEKQLNSQHISGNSILCIGDSFTESFGSSKNNDYPSQLGRIIKRRYGNKYPVYNLGRSGKNTRQISMELPFYIEKFNPKIAVILSGSANYWNYWGYKKESFWSSFKTIKLFKLLFNNVKYRENKYKFNFIEYKHRRNQFRQLLSLTIRPETQFIAKLRAIALSTHLQYLDSCIGNENLSVENLMHLTRFSILSGRSSEIIDKIDMKKIHSPYERFLIALYREKFLGKKFDISNYFPGYQAIYLYKMMKPTDYTPEALELFIKASPYFEEPYYQLTLLGNNEIRIPTDYDQKRFSIKDSVYYYRSLYALSQDDNYFDENTYIQEDPDLEIMTKEINGWVKDDIEKMVELCIQKGISVVLMNYPLYSNATAFSSVNKVNEDIASKYNLPFVDNSRLFDTIKMERNSYFISDGHCSDIGYRLMAQNLFTVIDNYHLLEKNK